MNERPSEEVIRARIGSFLLQESTEPLTWWYLSFTDATRPKGTQFLGAVVIEAHGFTSAITESHRLGLNPGGAVRFIQVPPGKAPHPRHRGRLLDAEEARDMELVDAPPEAVK